MSKPPQKILKKPRPPSSPRLEHLEKDAQKTPERVSSGSTLPEEPKLMSDFAKLSHVQKMSYREKLEYANPVELASTQQQSSTQTEYDKHIGDYSKKLKESSKLINEQRSKFEEEIELSTEDENDETTKVHTSSLSVITYFPLFGIVFFPNFRDLIFSLRIMSRVSA